MQKPQGTKKADKEGDCSQPHEIEIHGRRPRKQSSAADSSAEA
jgi:hypothetical protein